MDKVEINPDINVIILSHLKYMIFYLNNGNTINLIYPKTTNNVYATQATTKIGLLEQFSK